MSRIRASPITTQRMLAEIRSQLPVGEYLSVLHTLALTGQMPCYDTAPAHDPHAPPRRNGQFTPPDRELQHKTLTFLVDKAFAPIERPAAATLARAAELVEQHAELTSHADARNLTVSELIRRLAAPAAPPTSDPALPEPDHHAQMPVDSAAPGLLAVYT